MRTSVTELGDSRVRVEVGIEADAVQDRLERAAHELARDMRMPGFRKGKVPAQLVIQRVGREAVLEQALRDSLPEWYERALLDTGITPVGDPELNVASLPSAGEELSFSIEVAVRPGAKLGEYKGLEVGRAEAEVPAEAVQAELDRLREGFASLDPVDRPAADGRPGRDRLLRDRRRRAVRGLGGHRPDGRAWGGEPAARVRPGPYRRGGGRPGDRRGPVRRRPPAREPGGQAGELRGHRQGGPGEEAAGARRRVRRRGVGVRDAR